MQNSTFVGFGSFTADGDAPSAGELVDILAANIYRIYQGCIFHNNPAAQFRFSGTGRGPNDGCRVLISYSVVRRI
jgi:hypothetical protein